MNKENKIILITGTSTGFGNETALKLAAEGHTVYATMRNVKSKNAEHAKALADASDNIRILDLDVTDDASVQAAMDVVLEQSGRIDVVVNNAGIMNVGITEGYSIEQMQKQMDVNYYGPARLYKAALPAMKQQQSGLFITVTSIAGRLTFPMFGTYCSSKYAAEALAEGYRYELSSFGIDSVVVEPGPFNTPLLDNNNTPEDTDRLKPYGEMNELADGILASFHGSFDEAPADHDPVIVADDIIALVNAPFGERPFRTVSGLDFGARELNTFNETTRLNVLNAMELSHMEPAALEAIRKAS